MTSGRTAAVQHLRQATAAGGSGGSGGVGAVGPFPQAAGMASALNGFMMMLAAFAMGGWVGRHLDGTVWPLVYGVWFWSLVLGAVAWILVPRFGEPRE